ncbi:biotin synthase auxiliary protein BsaP [Microbacterium karelineae]|uniref:biotin synthase auxiliary protein BsaP n=1 Tax=Microbacterium karelineae TaxID=2654283 RepID=UPI003F661275
MEFCTRCGSAACGCRDTALEPPRFCGRCRRRLKVQVTPSGWTAACSRHGAEVARA